MAEQPQGFKIFLRVTLFASIVLACAYGQTQVTPASLSVLEQGERQLQEGRTTLDRSILNNAHRTFEQCAQQKPKSQRCLYQLARTDSYLRQSAEYAKDEAAAKHWLDTAIADAQRAIAVDDRLSDAHALLGDLYGAKITGMFSGMHYGPKANAEVERAFQLDPNSPRAFAAVGRKYFYAPNMFGGNIEKAIASFKKATELDLHDDEAFVWLAIAYRKKGDAAKSQQALAEALRLNPQSAFALRVQSGKGQ